MIKVRLTKKENILELEIKGHAGFEKVGMDIVCAAVSILSYSFHETCLNDNRVELLYRYEKSGYTNICVEDDKQILGSAVNMLHAGFLALSENYPQCVELVWDEI